MIDRRLLDTCVCLAGFFSILLFAGCRSGLQHPPTFRDYQRATGNPLEDQYAFNQHMKLAEAAQFTPGELQRIGKRAVVEELIGAACHAAADAPESVMLLDKATAIKPADPVPWAAAAYHYLPLRTPNLPVTDHARRFTNAVENWSWHDRNNAMPSYMLALHNLSRPETRAQGRELFLAAGQKPVLQTYDRDVRRCVTIAAKSVGYSDYTARIIALGHGDGTTMLTLLGQSLRTNYSGDEAVMMACLKLGRQMEQQSVLFIDQLAAMSMQSAAMERLPNGTWAPELARFQTLRRQITEAINFLYSAPASGVSEERWSQYFDDVFIRGEMEATRSLASDTGNAFLVPRGK